MSQNVPFVLYNDADAKSWYSILKTGRRFPLRHQASRRVNAYSPYVMQACIPDVPEAVIKGQVYTKASYWTRMKGLGTETRQ